MLPGPSPVLARSCQRDAGPTRTLIRPVLPLALDPLPMGNRPGRNRGDPRRGSRIRVSRRGPARPSQNFRTNPPMRLRPSTQPQWHRHRVEFLTGPPGPGLGRAPTLLSPSRRPPPALVSGLPFESTTLNKNKCHRRRKRSRKLQYLTSGGVPPRAGLDRPDPWARNASLPTLIQQYGGQNAPQNEPP